MPVRVSSSAFLRYLAAQSTTRVAKVREAKRMMEVRHEDFKRVDYWLLLRDASVSLLTGDHTAQDFGKTIANVTDPKKTANYGAAATGLQAWMGRKPITATPVLGRVWRSSGLEVSVTPEVAISWPGSSTYVLKLYFSADTLSKNLANPMLRLIEHTHGDLGTAALLEAQRSKLHTGPTARPGDLDILLKTEAASFLAIWNSI